MKIQTYPEFDVLGVESVDIAVAPVGDVDEVLVGGAVVAGGATTFPLLKLTAPKFEVKAADDVAAVPGVDVGEAWPFAMGEAPVDLETAPVGWKKSSRWSLCFHEIWSF